MLDMLGSPLYLFPQGDQCPWHLTLQQLVGGSPLQFRRVPVYLKQLPPKPQESSQAGMADVMAHSSCSPSPIPGTPERDSSPTPLQLQANSITLPDNVLHLQEEMNNAMVHLPILKASVDAHWQKPISKMEIAHCQNETKTSETIKEIEACSMTALSNAKATCVAAIRGVEAAHAASTRGQRLSAPLQ